MPIYTYTALSENGALTTGEGVAGTVAELNEELTNKGLLVQSISKKRVGRMVPKRQRVKTDAFILFNQEFTALIGAGLTIPEALKLAADRPDQPLLATILKNVLEDVRSGKLFSEACGRHPEIFDGLYLSALKTGEKTGTLVAVLNKYQESLKTKIEFEKKVSHALAYPIFLLITLLVILGVLFVFVLPRFVAMYADFGAELPLPTRILVSIVKHLPIVLAIVVGLGAFITFIWRSWMTTDKGRLWIDTLKEKIPLLGDVNRHIAVARITRTLSTLLSGGTPLVEAMRTTGQSLTNRVDKNRLEKATVLVTEGETLAKAFHATDIIPSTGLKMIEAGEASGALDNMLMQVAQYYEGMLANKLARLMVLIEPMLMLLMGVLIGGVIVVMYLPIFYMVDIVK